MAELIATGPIFMEVHGPAEQVANVVKTTEGVEHVSQRGNSDGVVTLEVLTRGGKDLRETLAARITRNGWSIRQLERRGRRLEEHFMDVISHGAASSKAG